MLNMRERNAHKYILYISSQTYPSQPFKKKSSDILFNSSNNTLENDEQVILSVLFIQVITNNHTLNTQYDHRILQRAGCFRLFYDFIKNE